MTWANFWPPFRQLQLDLLHCNVHMQLIDSGHIKNNMRQHSKCRRSGRSEKSEQSFHVGSV